MEGLYIPYRSLMEALCTFLQREPRGFRRSSGWKLPAASWKLSAWPGTTFPESPKGGFKGLGFRVV